MRILGIDPGSRITGFGVVEQSGGRVRYVESGCIRVGEHDFARRLKVIFDELRDVMAIYAPQEAAIEQVFMHRNADSALKLGQARGAAICAIMMTGVELAEYAPTEIKKATVGKGHASKDQVQHMVRALLDLPGMPQPDAADALAVALCHSHARTILGQARGAERLKRGKRR